VPVLGAGHIIAYIFTKHIAYMLQHPIFGIE